MLVEVDDLTPIDLEVEWSPGLKAAFQIGDAWFWPVGASEVCARMRRGKWVLIPTEWRGKVPHPPTIRKRPSKMTRKARHRAKHIKAEAKMEKGV